MALVKVFQMLWLAHFFFLLAHQRPELTVYLLAYYIVPLYKHQYKEIINVIHIFLSDQNIFNTLSNVQ